MAPLKCKFTSWMKSLLLLALSFCFLTVSCTKEPPEDLPTPTLTAEQLEVIEYFKDIALGFEFGGASAITRKWPNDLRIYVSGDASAEILAELDTIILEINELATDGFEIELVSDSLASNCHIFFGDAATYADQYPEVTNQVNVNWGLFYVYWNSQDQFTRGHMYVDITRANLVEQKHLLREELTQSLGLAQDSPQYQESIFQINWTTTTEYAPIDRELIRLLYHPLMQIGLDDAEVDQQLRNILLTE
jgi:hypothetical protein